MFSVVRQFADVKTLLSSRLIGMSWVTWCSLASWVQNVWIPRLKGSLLVSPMANSSVLHRSTCRWRRGVGALFVVLRVIWWVLLRRPRNLLVWVWRWIRLLLAKLNSGFSTVVVRQTLRVGPLTIPSSVTRGWTRGVLSRPLWVLVQIGTLRVARVLIQVGKLLCVVSRT